MNNNSPALLSIVRTLEENISRIQYGEASVTLKVHSGRIASVTHSLTENRRKTIIDGEAEKGAVSGNVL